MADKKITKKPSGKVSCLAAPKRESGYKFTATWRIPDSLKSTNYEDRAKSLPYKWVLNGKNNGKAVTATATGEVWINGTNDTSRSVWLTNFPAKIDGRNINRNDYYPVHKTRFLKGITFSIQAKNDKGTGAWVTQTRKFEYPRAPVISNVQHNDETGEVTARLVTDAGADYRERLDTQYVITLEDSRSGNPTKTLANSTTRGTDVTITGEVAERFAIKPGEYLTVRFNAWARGYAGRTKATEKTHVIAYPKAATISYNKPTDISSPDAKLIVNVDTHHSATTAPVDGVQLEVLRSVDISDEKAAIASDAWEELDVVDDAQCKALVADIGDIIPERGKKTWLRVKSWHDIKTVYYTNSKPIYISELTTDIAAGSAEVTNPVPSADGESASVDVYWDSTGTESADGTELSWSKDEDSWISTKQPQTFPFDNTWGKPTGATGAGEWRKKATVVIKELNNEPVYARVRRFTDEDSGRVFGSYSPTIYISPTQAPDAAVLSAPFYVIKGDSATFAWGFSSTAKQDSWVLVKGDGTGNLGNGDDAYTTHTVEWDALAAAAVDATFTQRLAGVGEVTLSPKSGSTIIVRSPEQAWSHDFDAGTNGTFTEAYPDGNHTFTWTASTHKLAYSLPDEFTAELVYAPSNVAGVVSVYVSVSTGGKWVSSPTQTVRLYNPPVLTVDAPNALTAQPLEVDLSSDVATAEAIVRVYSQGSDGANPSGRDNAQVNGDTIWSDTFLPEWEYNSNTGLYDYTLELPGGLDFRDNADYTIEVMLTDTLTGLQSEVVSNDFGVAWTNQAQVPPDAIEVVPSVSVDADGMTRRIATINLSAPTGAAATSVYDIYRLTADGAQLVAESRGLTDTVVDEFAPFGTGYTAYRVALRTIDGDVEWADFSYRLDTYCLRFDFGGGYLEVPFAVNIRNQFSKDFERVRKASGHDDGFWNQGTEHQASLSTDPVIFDDERQIERILALARYAGAVLVRTPDGLCYAANVNVSGVDNTTTTRTIAVSFDAVEVELTDEFRIPPADTADGASGATGAT